MSESLVLYESRPPAVLITLHRADKRNALSRGLIAELTDAFDRARNDPAARCVVRAWRSSFRRSYARRRL